MNFLYPKITIDKNANVTFYPSLPLFFENKNTSITFDQPDPEDSEEYDETVEI